MNNQGLFVFGFLKSPFNKTMASPHPFSQSQQTDEVPRPWRCSLRSRRASTWSASPHTFHHTTLTRTTTHPFNHSSHHHQPPRWLVVEPNELTIQKVIPAQQKRPMKSTMAVIHAGALNAKQMILEKKWWIFFRQLLSKTTLIFDNFQLNTVSLSRHVQNIDTSQGLIHLRWCRISAINSSSYKIQPFLNRKYTVRLLLVCPFVPAALFLQGLLLNMDVFAQKNITKTCGANQPLFSTPVSPPKTNMTME